MRRVPHGLILLVLLFAARAGADPAVDGARAHFKAGEALFNAGLFDRAVEEYRQAYALVPRPQLLFNIGSAYRRKAETSHARRDLEAAIEHYERYLEAEPEGKGAEAARAYITTLRAEASTAPPDTEPEPAPPAAAPVAVPPPVPAPLIEATSGDRPHRERPWRIAGLVTAGGGVALVGAGIAFALKSQAASDELQDLVHMEGNTWDKDKFDSGRSAGHIATACFVVGGVALASGGILYFVLGRRPEVQVTPVVGSGGAGLSVAGGF